MKIFGLMLFGMAMLTGYLWPKGDSGGREPALEITCPDFTIIAAPADQHITVAMAHRMADALGEEREMICTIGNIALHRNKGETK